MTRPKLVTLPQIPIADVGEWDCLTGTTEFTHAMLASAVEASKDPGIGLPRIKRGHVDPRFDGEPLLGIATALNLDEHGMMRANLAGLDPEFAEALPFRYPDRSVEGRRNVTSPVTGKTYEFAITALALLPSDGAVETLPDLPLPHHMNEGTAVAASKHFQVTRSESRPEPQNKERSMDPKMLRASLGLAEDATAEDVAAKLAEEGVIAGTPPVPGQDGKEGEETPAPKPEEDGGGSETPEPKPEESKPGTVVLDEATFNELKEGASIAASLKRDKDIAERDSLLNAAVMAGKFPKRRVEHYARMFDGDPQGTREHIESLTPGLIPVDGETGVMAGAGDTGEADLSNIMASFGVAPVGKAG